MIEPWKKFHSWYQEAVKAKEPEPSAMTLATATKAAVPSARIVLYKEIQKGQICFFSNYQSRKARELKMNPRAAVVFFWPKLGKQIRIEGKVSMLSEAQSDDYWKTRPRLSQIGAWASNQSEELKSQKELLWRVAKLAARFGTHPIPRPPHWGGYGLTPKTFEFWQIQAGRLHTREEFRWSGSQWHRRILNP